MCFRMDSEVRSRTHLTLTRPSILVCRFFTMYHGVTTICSLNWTPRAIKCRGLRSFERRTAGCAINLRMMTAGKPQRETAHDGVFAIALALWILTEIRFERCLASPQKTKLGLALRSLSGNSRGTRLSLCVNSRVINASATPHARETVRGNVRRDPTMSTAAYRTTSHREVPCKPLCAKSHRTTSCSFETSANPSSARSWWFDILCAYPVNGYASG
jgi:hypothetical protein